MWEWSTELNSDVPRWTAIFLDDVQNFASNVDKSMQSLSRVSVKVSTSWNASAILIHTASGKGESAGHQLSLFIASSENVDAELGGWKLCKLQDESGDDILESIQNIAKLECCCCITVVGSLYISINEKLYFGNSCFSDLNLLHTLSSGDVVALHSCELSEKGRFTVVLTDTGCVWILFENHSGPVETGESFKNTAVDECPHKKTEMEDSRNDVSALVQVHFPLKGMQAQKVSNHLV